MNYVMIVKFVQAIWPCIQQNYPDLVNGLLQVVGGASVIYKVAQMYAPSTTTPGGSPLSGLVSLIGKIGLSK